MEKTKEEKPVVLTEQQKELIEKISEIIGVDVKSIDIDKVALHKDSLDNYYSVMYNFSGTGIHIPEDEVDEYDFKDNGMKVFHTCTYNL